MGYLRIWVDMLVGMGLRNVIIVEPVKSLLSMYFLNVHHAIPKDKNLLDYLKQVLLLDTFEDYMCCSGLDKTVVRLGEKQGMIVNDDCSLWYNRVGDFFDVGMGEKEGNFIWRGISL